jgi:site-specific DNA recombinase
MLALYCRTSKDKENEKTIDQQIQEGKEFANKNSKQCLIYSDMDLSGFEEDFSKRLELMRLLDDVKTGKIQEVWEYESSRLSRNTITQGIIYREFIKYKVKLFIRDTEYDLQNPDDKLILGIYSSFDEYERQKIVLRTNRGQLVKRSQGIKVCKSLYGYRKGNRNSDHRIEWKLVDEEVKTIKKIFDIYIKEKSISKVVTYFGNIGTSKEKLMKVSYYQRILNRIEYTGRTIAPNGEIIKCITFPNEIININQYNKVQELLKRNRLNQDMRSHINSKLLTGIIHCSKCEEKYYYVTTSAKNNSETRYHYYKHSNISSLANCTNRPLYINQSEIDDVFRIIMNKVYHNQKEMMPRANEEINMNKQKQDLLDTMIKQNTKKLTELKKGISKLLDFIERGEEVDLVHERISKRKQEIKELEASINQMEKQKNEEVETVNDIVRNLSRDIFKNFFAMPDNEKRKQIRNYVSDMVIEDEKLKIEFKYGSRAEVYLPKTKVREYTTDIIIDNKVIDAFTTTFIDGEPRTKEEDERIRELE